MPDELITIDGDGRIIASAELRERLRQRHGSWRLIPTVDSLLVMYRADGQTAAGRPTLCGEIGAGGLIDIINFIASSRWTGVLTIVSADMVKSIYVKRGDVKAASSNQPQDRLGDIIYRFGGITKQQLESALGEVRRNRKIGKVLVERNYLNAHRLWQFIRTQIEEIFYSVVTLQQGSFTFVPRSEDEFHTNLTLPTQNLLMEAVRRLDEWAVFREKLPSMRVVITLRQPQPENVKLEANEEQVLSAIDGTRDVSALALESGLGDFETTKIVYQLIRSRFVEVVGERDLTRDGIETVDHRLSNVLDTFNSIFTKIYSEVRRKGTENSLRAGLDAFFTGTSGFGDLFQGLQINEEGALDKEALLVNLEKIDTPNDVDFLYQGLNELLFFELFAAGETLDKTEERNLQRVLQELLRELGDSARPA